MIAVTHTGSISDIAYILPICSWIEKNKGHKIVFIFPNSTPNIEAIIPLLKIQKFTEDVRLINNATNKFNPQDFVDDIKFIEYYNFSTPLKYPNYITEFQANVNNLGVDNDFILNLDLEFKYGKDILSITPGLMDIFPNYHVIQDKGDMLNILREFAYSKERHANFDDVATFLAFAKIPFYLYLFKKEGGYYVNENKESFWLKLRDASILDIRTFDSKRNITSYYDKIYFNQ